MKVKQTPISQAVLIALLGATGGAALAQQQAPAANSQQLETVVVTGIRAAQERSLTSKRNADTAVEVITAEDIGKMPDKNVADSLQRIVGVNTTAGGSAGSLGENEKVSLRGAADNLTLTTLNGHSVASADWFWEDIINSGRSVSYSLLPSELVGKITVNKGSQASLPDGGVSGVVDIQSRRPLDFKNQLSAFGSVGIAHQNYAGKNDPQLSGLVSWHDEARRFGVLLQVFSQKRSLKREEFENVWKLYEDTSWFGDTSKALAAAGVDISKPHRYAPLNGSAVFEQERKREGGMVDVQWKPTNELELGFNAFSSKLNAKNFNTNWMQSNHHLLNQGVVPTKAVVTNGVITELQFSGPCVIAPGATGNCAAANSSAVDLAARPDAYTKTDFVNFDAKWKASDKLSFTTQVGSTKSAGHSKDYAIEIWGPYAATGYKMDGGANAYNITFPSSTTYANGNTGTDAVQGWSNVMDTRDKENYFHVDGTYDLGEGFFSSIQFGLRATDHKRDRSWTEGTRSDAAKMASAFPADKVYTYTGFGADIPGGALANFWTLPHDAVVAYGDKYINFDAKNQDWSKAFNFKERVTAGYVQGNFESGALRGNIGVRFVQTKDDVHQYRVDNVNGTLTRVDNTDKYAAWDTSKKFNDVLPSLNLRYEFTRDLVGRFSLSRTMSHPDYGKYAGINLNDTTLAAGGANPELAPTTSNNVDLGVEWYFAPRSVLSASLFYSKLKDYVTQGSSKVAFYNAITKKVEQYDFGGPVGTDARVQGVELGYQQSIGMGFGVDANYTYADGKETKAVPGSLCATDGFLNVTDCTMFGTSKNTYNLGAFFENDTFNARIGYSHRSPYLFGVVPSKSVYVKNGGALSASFNYNVTQNLTVSLEGQNLTNPLMSTTSARTRDPVDVGRQGRTYFITLRGKY